MTTYVSLAIAAWALFVAWRTLRATAKQAETAEHTRKLSIRPYVVAFTRQYAHQSETIYLMVANVGFGAARDVRARIVGNVSSDVPDSIELITEWAPLQKSISVLRVDERLWTVFHMITENEPSDFSPEVCIEITYSDMEGTAFAPERFTLDWLPNNGVNFGRLKRTRGGEIVEERALYPEDL